ncbi:MAG: hypothetical protein J6W73_03640, partial [Verrucomicrobia bacterium]|nr:hypothetical protein [Verrucomicrobiota bacterium]
DFFAFNDLNYWIIAKLMWNSSLDPEALLNEYFSKMFGKGAPFMAEFYADLERNWCEKILGNTVMTDLGPETRVPAVREIWGNIYSAAKIEQYNALFDKALAAAAADKGAVERIRFVRTHLLGPIARAAGHFHQLQNGMDFWIAWCPGTVWLQPFKGENHDVNTSVSLRKEGENLVISGECEEPRMKEILAKCTKRDDPMTFADSCVEILLNPSGDRENYYQFVVNSNGALTDYKCRRNSKSQIAWNSGAAAKAEKLDSSWRFELRIPLKDLGPVSADGMPANFARNRAFANGAQPVYYMWTLFPGEDPAVWLAKYPNRWEMMHLKDLKKGVEGNHNGGTDTKNDVVLGTGQVNFPRVLKAAQEAGVLYYFIEDESPTPKEQLPQSLDYLERVRF